MAMATTTALTIAAVASVAGAGISAYSQYQAGKAQKAMADYNAKLAENEAIAKQQATAAETQRMRAQAERMKATQRAAYAKSGAITTEGTPLLTMAEQAGMMELDILNMQRSGAMGAQASRSQAALSRFSGQQAASAGMFGAGGTLLQGAGQAASIGAMSSGGGNNGAGFSNDGYTSMSNAPSIVKEKYGW